MTAVKTTELMGFEIEKWRWSTPRSRSQAKGEPPASLNFTIEHQKLANGYSPPRESLEEMSEALEKVAREALHRNGPDYPHLHASHWSGGYELKWEDGYWRPYWHASTWKIFTNDRAGSELLATATVTPHVIR